jgi:hypothetical protein
MILENIYSVKKLLAPIKKWSAAQKYTAQYFNVGKKKTQNDILEVRCKKKSKNKSIQSCV